MNFIWYIIIGIIAGFFADKIIRGGYFVLASPYLLSKLIM